MILAWHRRPQRATRQIELNLLQLKAGVDGEYNYTIRKLGKRINVTTKIIRKPRRPAAAAA